jgi:hypothetical protein
MRRSTRESRSGNGSDAIRQSTAAATPLVATSLASAVYGWTERVAGEADLQDPLRFAAVAAEVGLGLEARDGNAVQGS